MTRSNFLGILSLVSIVFLLAACGSLGPPQECPVTGTANPEAFDQSFTRMVLVKQGQPMPDTGGDSDLTFTSDDRLELVVVSKGGTQALVCVGPRKGGVKIPYNKTVPITEGVNRVELGSFVVNPYVVRVSVNNVLVKNVTFETK